MTTELDASAFEAALLQRVVRLRENAKLEERRLAEETADRMRETVPTATGETASTIRVVQTIEGTDIHMGGASLFLEFGTRKMSPKPFARPAIAEAPGRFRPPSFH